MRTTHLFGLGVVSALAACAGNGEGGDDVGSADEQQHALSFHGEQAALPGLAYDTGLLPAASPVQLQLKFSAGGKLTVDADAMVGGAADALAVAGTPGSGRFALDAHVKAEGRLKVAISGLPPYDGPIPGIENLDISLTSETMFNPFLINGSAKLTVNLPSDIKLPPIPLGSLPGKLIITVSKASTVTSDLHRLCAGIDVAKLQYLAETATSANIVLSPKIVFTIPVIGDKEFAIPSVTIPVSAITAPLDLGIQDLVAGGDKPTGASMAQTNACDGGLTCKPSTAAFTATWHPPAALHTNQCTSAQIYALVSACATETSSGAKCREFLDAPANSTCARCMITDDKAASYGAIVESVFGGMYNVEGCIAIKDPAMLACAKSQQAQWECDSAACSAGCGNASYDDAIECAVEADAGTCSSYSVPTECDSMLYASPAFECTSQPSSEDMMRYYAQLFCGV